MDDNGIFNSSDIEFDEPPPNPFSGVGKASIDAIIAHAVEDRIESKKISKQLTFVKGRPGTQYRNMLWYQRFQSFREHSLRVRYVNNTRSIAMNRGPRFSPITKSCVELLSQDGFVHSLLMGV